jgi:mono/diheme cytochrome c family protein
MKMIVFLIALATMTTAQAAEPSAGEKLFLTNCSSCHGPDGKAQTDIGKAVKARNLVADTFKQMKNSKKGPTEDDVFNTLKTGVPGTGMASFAHLPEADRKALAKYVISLRKGKK